MKTKALKAKFNGLCVHTHVNQLMMTVSKASLLADFAYSAQSFVAMAMLVVKCPAHLVRVAIESLYKDFQKEILIA